MQYITADKYILAIGYLKTSISPLTRFIRYGGYQCCTVFNKY